MTEERICCVDGCDTPNKKVSELDGKLYCNKHYKQMVRNGKITHVKNFKNPLPKQCIVEGCMKKPVGNGYCAKHYHHINKYGEIRETRYDKNEIIKYETYAEIIMKGNDLKETGRVKVDLNIIDDIKDYKWHLISSGYAYCSTLKSLLHRFVLNLNKDDKVFVDHENRDKLDCRKFNLRISNDVTNSQNQSVRVDNSYGVIGVSKTKNNKWRAYIHEHQGKNIKSKYIQLGTFENIDDAIKSRLLAEVKYFGDFAPQKHLFEQYGIVADSHN